MISPDYARRTLEAYGVYASRAVENWSRIRQPSRFLRRFAAGLPRGGRVLDYGCGIGAELAWLRRRGFAAEGLDGARVFVREARRRAPGALVRWAAFEQAALPADAFDGIWCQAALIHVPPSELRRQLRALRRALKPGGRLGLVLAWGRSRGYIARDWIPGRYFAAYTKAEAAGFLRGWREVEVRVAATDGRTGRWIQILAERAPAARK